MDKTRVLVIDDDEMVCNSISMALNNDGLEAFCAKSGQQASDIQEKTPVDILITDIFMPGEDGLEVIVKFKRNYPKVKIIAISGSSSSMTSHYLHCAKEFGADITLEKPFSHPQLRHAINSISKP